MSVCTFFRGTAGRSGLIFGLGWLVALGARGQAPPIPGLPFWQWQTPLATGYHLTGIHPFNDSTAIAVGGHGTALKSTDGGASWRALDTGTRDRLTQVSFASEQVGWAGVYTSPSSIYGPPPYYPYGGPGEVRKTTDGGQTWTRQPLRREGTRIWGMQALSPTECVVVFDQKSCGSQPCGGYPAILLARTTDGGNTWTYGTWPSDFNGNFRFLSSQVGYVSNNIFMPSATVQKTTDGGQTWRDVTPVAGRGYGALAFPDSLHGWVASRLLVGSTLAPPNLFRTRDGGRHWTAQHVTTTPGNEPDLISLTFADTLHGVAQGSGGMMDVTADGGQTWRESRDPTAPAGTGALGAGYSLGAVAVAPGGHRFWGVSLTGFTTTSADDGLTWHARAHNPIDGVYLYDNAYANVRFADPVRGLTWGLHHYAYTTDRGAHWPAANVNDLPMLPAQTYRQIKGMDFVDRDTAFALVQYTPGSTWSAAVLRTATGGRTWQSVATLPNIPVRPSPGASYFDGGLHALRFGSSRRGVMVGDLGSIYLTTDGGQTWQRPPSPTRNTLRNVAWAGPGAQTVYASGDSATLVRSDDGGQSWRTVPIDSVTVMTSPTQKMTYYNLQNVSLPRMRFTAPAAGYMPFGAGVARTTDGGRTWQNNHALTYMATYSPAGIPDPGSTNVEFRNAREGWLFGSDNFRTFDGGIGWTKTPDVLGDALGSPVAGGGTLVDRYNAWLVGQSIVRYSEKFIRTDTALARTSFCLSGGSDSLLVPFTLEGTFAAAEQDFRVELSSATGRFRPGHTTLIGQGAASPLLARFPAGLAPGRYRLRVIRADSSVLGADNGIDLQFNARPAAVAVAPADSAAICAGDSVQLTAPAGFGIYQWNTGATTRAVWVRAAGAYAVQVGGALDCLSPASDSVRVQVKPVPAQPTITVAPQPSGAVVLTSSAPAGNQWSFNGQPIAGATGPTYTVSTGAQNGSYSVQVTLAGCNSPWSGAVPVILLSAAPDAWADAEVRVVPNPARDVLTVQAPAGARLTRVTLVDLAGRVVAHRAADSERATLPLAGVAAGTYLLRAERATGAVVVRRVVVAP